VTQVHDALDEPALVSSADTSRPPFAPPRWLRDIGRTSWLLVGAVLLLVGFIWLIGATSTIVAPVLAGTVVAVAALPLVDVLDRHMPRAAAAAIVLLGVAAVVVIVTLVILTGIVDQSDSIKAHLHEGMARVQSWLTSAGVSDGTASSATATTEHSAPETLSILLTGAISAIGGIASLILGLSFAALSLFFILKDGPPMQKWIDAHVGLPEETAHVITHRLATSLRGYFKGVTFVAAFNGIVVGLGALLLDVPLAGTLAVVTFVTAYVPYIGAVIAGIFVVVVTLGAKGAAVALAMLVVFLLANGLLQNLMQPLAMGSALELHPLVVLVATVGAGCLFGTVGLILAAPLLSAATHLPRDLRLHRLAART
jgi:predicted PurR-regulated permease PerM